MAKTVVVKFNMDRLAGLIVLAFWIGRDIDMDPVELMAAAPPGMREVALNAANAAVDYIVGAMREADSALVVSAGATPPRHELQ